MHSCHSRLTMIISHFRLLILLLAQNLLESLQSKRHNHIVLTHNGTLDPNSGMQSSSCVPKSNNSPPPPFESILSEGKNKLMNDVITKHW